MSKKFARLMVDKVAWYAEVRGDEAALLDVAPWHEGRPTGRVVPLEQVQWLPVSEASKVVAVAQNYKKHAAEMGKPIPPEPILFIKPSTALNGHQSPIVLPPESSEVHHEAEVAIVIGQKLTRVSESQAQKAIFGVTCFNDVTARDIQKREMQHTRGKSYDTFACVGPWVVTGLDWAHLRIQGRLNGVTRQDGNSDDMIFPIPMLVSFISRAMTLLPGDIITTGTPSGVGPIVDGDVIEIEVEGVGVLRNPVKRL